MYFQFAGQRLNYRAPTPQQKKTDTKGKWFSIIEVVYYPKQNLNNLEHLAKSKVPLVNTGIQNKLHNCCGKQQRMQYLLIQLKCTFWGKVKVKELSFISPSLQYLLSHLSHCGSLTSHTLYETFPVYTTGQLAPQANYDEHSSKRHS